MSQTDVSQSEPERTSAVATAGRALREPLALALLGYLVLLFLIALGRLILGERLGSVGGGPSFAERASNQHSAYLGLFTLMLLVIVALLVTAGDPTKHARPIVLTTVVLTVFALVVGLVAMIAGLFVAGSGGINSTRDKAEDILLDLPVIVLYVLFALFLVKLLATPALRRAPKPVAPPTYAQQYPGAAPQGILGFATEQQQQQYAYQQPQQAAPYDPWQGYPQQGYHQPYHADQPYQPQPPAYAHPSYQLPEPPQQPAYQLPEPPQQPQQPPPAQQPPPVPLGQQPPYHQPERPAEPAAPAEADKRPEASTPTQQLSYGLFQPYQPSHKPEYQPEPEQRSSPPPPVWPEQPAQARSADDDDKQRSNQQPPEHNDFRFRYREPDPPPPHGWNGPHL